MSYVSISQYPLNKSNPFAEETIEHIQKKDKTIFMGNKNHQSMIVNQNTGAIDGYSVFAKRVTVDAAEFVKVYKSNVSQFFELTLSSSKILEFIMVNLKQNDDRIIILHDEVKESVGCSRKTLISSLGQLMENKIIARGRFQNEYFINPTIFFNGDRMTFVKQYIKETKNSDLLT